MNYVKTIPYTSRSFHTPLKIYNSLKKWMIMHNNKKWTKIKTLI